MTIAVTLDEAEGRLAALLEQLDNGEEVVITRDGKPVARLSPVASGTPIPGSQLALKGAEDILAFRARLSARGISLPWSELKAYRDEGRR